MENNNEYIGTTEAAVLLQMTGRRVVGLCTEGKLSGAFRSGRNWKIPEEERFKRLSVSRTFERQRKECLERITSEEGIKLRVNRSIQAEGSFALWKEDGSFRQFLCRGQANVYAESVLMAIAQNVDNLHRRIQNGKLGMHLYEV